MTEYVCCFAYQHPAAVPQHFLLIEKQKPAWQKGKFNLPGGKIEEGETPIEAAVRELWEESGIRTGKAYQSGPQGTYGGTVQPEVLGKIVGDDWVVHVVECPYHQGQTPQSLTNERIIEASLGAALTHPQLIPNLRVIIPLCVTRSKGWTVQDYGGSHDFGMCLQPLSPVGAE